MGKIGCARRSPRHILAGTFKLAISPTLTGSDNNGLPQSVEPAVEANYVFAFVGDTQRPDEWGSRDQEIERNDWGDGEDRSITRMDTNGRPSTKMGTTKELKLLSGERLG